MLAQTDAGTPPINPNNNGSLPPGKPFVYPAVWNGRDLSGHPVPPGAYILSARPASNNLPSVTGGVIVNTDPDPTNMGKPTRTPVKAAVVIK